MEKKHYKEINAAAVLLRKIDIAALNAHIETLREKDDEARNDHSDKSEKWQESEAGTEEMDRIEAAYAILTALESVVANIEEADKTIQEFENEAPEGAFN